MRRKYIKIFTNLTKNKNEDDDEHQQEKAGGEQDGSG